MRDLFQAGLVAACIQAIAVVGMTALVTFLLRYHPMILVTIESGSESLVRLLTWVELLLALGLALTRNRFVNGTAARISAAARSLSPTAPDGVCTALYAQLLVTSFGLAVLALRPPSGVFVQMADALGGSAMVTLIWPSLMSIGVAAFGATAHAAAKAF